MTKIILLDSNSLINRAFYALPLLTNPDGQYTNAIHGYLSMLQRLIIDEKPTHICAVFDEREKTFRSKMYEAYKANRKGMPEELFQQLEPLKKVLTLMGIKVLSKSTYEADDIIGTLAKRFNEDTLIVTGDRDSFQLVSDSTKVIFTKQGVTNIVKIDLEKLKEDGFTPELVVEMKGLAGDSSDNIPGAKGIGEKTAVDLLHRYGDIEGIYNSIDEIKGKLKEKLVESRDMVILSRELATINTDVPVECTLSDITFSDVFSAEALKYMQWLDLRKLILKFKFSENEEKEEITEQLTFETVEINNLFNLNKCVNKLEKSGRISLNLDGELSFSDGKTNYVVTIAEGFFGDGVSMQDALSAIEPLLGDDCTTVVYDAKNVMYLLREYDLALNSPFEDVQLKGYLINPNRKVTDLKGLLADYRVDCAPAVGMLVLDGKLDEKLSELSLSSLYRDMELPLVKVLFDMETQGFCIDIKLLEELSKQYDDELKELTEKIYDEAGERNFNINSTKQLASLLFDKLNLQHGKKGKTGNYSVAADILAEIDHPIAKYLLRYREISKLKSTYIDGMRQVMNKTTGRVHTCFKQCLTVTGRLSSTEPNLQNIPVRTAEGREIRKMFVPEKGNLLVCSDYSQIELRLMASFSGDETLINSFKSGEDIHAVTASKMFGVPLNTVSQQMRRAAKAVNFGVIYGISGFGLSSNLDISQYEAQRYIRDYFIEHPKVREYMDSNVELAKRDGYLRTLFGRLRFFPELKSPKYQERAFAERAAMNMPLQGSAADIIKIAMLKVDKLLRERGLKSKLILQVHDELIVDAPEEEAERVKSLLIEGMESAVNLAVPLTVNVDVGKNWFEAK